MKNLVNILTLILLLSVGACSSEEISSEQSNVYTDAEITEIDAVIGKLQYEESRTAVTMGDFNNNSIKLVWAEKDTIGIYPTEGDQLSFPIVEGVGTIKCTFNSGGWALKTSTSYKAYSPFNRIYYLKESNKLPVSMLGQKQVGNGNSDHLCKYDLQIAEGKTPTSGKISFEFKHQVCFIRMDLIAPIAATWKSITLESDALFTTEASMNLSSETPTLTATSTANNVTLDLENVKTEEGETITAYMVVLPVNLTDKTLEVTLIDTDDNDFKTTAVIANDYRNFKAGYARWIKADDFPTEKKDIPYLTFTADALQSLTMSKAVETLEYSVNGGEWKELARNTVEFGGKLGTLRLRGKSLQGTGTSGNYSRILFNNNELVSCKGDIRTLIDYENYKNVETNKASFFGLFYNCRVLTTVPELPSTDLASCCYEEMFYNCTALTTAPQLPAMKLSMSCYNSMFSNCSSLTNAPELPATDLAESCYSNMFEGCTSLTSAPELPATTLKRYCYSNMFSNCTSLISAPELPATVLNERCYDYMFSKCTSLISAPELPSVNLEKFCYNHMFWRCTSLTSAPELPATNLAEFCYSGMFYECTSLIKGPKSLATNLANYCCEDMFYGCTSLTIAPELPATNLAEFCYARMFMECKSLTTAPELPAPILSPRCYVQMFHGCSKLENITMLATDISAENCLSSWTWIVSSTGTFTKAKEMVSLPEGSDGIPKKWTVKNYGEE